MTREEILNDLENASLDTLRDFNTYMDNNSTEYGVMPSDGSGATDGATIADEYMNLSQTDKDWIDSQATGFSIKHPCD